MKNQKIVYIFFLITLFFSCNKKKEIQEPITEVNNNLILIWEDVLSNPNEDYESLNPILFGDLIISSYYKPFSDSSEVIFSLNKSNGEEKWIWDDYIREGPQLIDGADRIHIKDNMLFACSSQDNYAIELNNGQTIWATNIEDGNPRTSIFEDLLFHTITFGSAPYGDSSKIVISSVDQGDWKDVFKVNKTGGFEVNLEPPAVFINQESDTLLVFQNRQINLSNYVERVDLYCYNLSLDSLIWFKEEFTSSGSSNVRVPKVDGNLIYFEGKWDLFCIDIQSGDVIWNINLYHTHLASNSLIYNDIIIINLDNGDLIAIDKFTGNTVWSNVGLSGCCTELRVYDDRLYFGNDKLFIVDPLNGQLLYEFRSPHPNGSFSTAIAVDIENKKMYAADKYYLMCFELPE